MSGSSVHRKTSDRSRGFTLIELLVVLVIMALVMAIAAPTLFQAQERGRLQDATARVYDALRRARSTAVTRAIPVTLELRGIVGDATILIEPAARNAALSSVIFYPDGSATAAHFTLSSGTQRQTLRLDWLTGHVALVE